MKITLLTTRRFDPTAIWLAEQFRIAGMDLTPSRVLTPKTDLALFWSYDRTRARRQIRNFCEARGIPILNSRTLGVLSVARRLQRAGIPVVPTMEVADRSAAREVLGGCPPPVELTTAFGGRVREVVDAADLENKWGPRHAIVRAVDKDMVRLAVVGGEVLGEATPAWTQLARAVSDALNVDFCVVRLCTFHGQPTVVSVSHRRPGIGSFPGAGEAMIRLAEKQKASEKPACVRGFRKPMVSIVTGIPEDETVEAIRRACVNQGLEPRVTTEVQADSDAAFFWGLHWRHHRDVWRHAETIGIPTLGGPWRSISDQLGALRRARLFVPDFRPARGADSAARWARRIGYPVMVGEDGDPDRHSCRLVFQESELRMACDQIEPPVLLQGLRWSSSTLLRAWVVGDSVLAVRSQPLADLSQGYRGVGLWSREEASQTIKVAAIAARNALGTGPCIVELLDEPDGVTVLRVLHRRVALEELPDEASEKIPVIMASEIANLLKEPDRPLAFAPPLKVVMARPYRRQNRMRIWCISAVYHELARRGHEVVHLFGRYDAQKIDQADLVLQDPLATMGWRRKPNPLNRRLLSETKVPCHLLRHHSGRGRGKLGSLSLARRLDLPHPRVYRPRSVQQGHLPVIIKPLHGSLGRGIFRVDDLDQLRRLNPRGKLVHEFIDSDTGYAVSARVVTVRDEVVAAGIFYSRGAVISNLSRGGRAVALTGPGASARLGTEAAMLLRRIGIDPTAPRVVPAKLVAMASKVGAHLATRGVQMVGQDYVVNRDGQWFFLEANRSFGIALFNVTDGDGYPSTRKGYRLAGTVLAQGFEKTVGRAPAKTTRHFRRRGGT